MTAPTMTVDRYGGSYSWTRVETRLSYVRRLLGWAVLWPFIPEPRPRRGGADTDFPRYLGSVMASRLGTDWQEMLGLDAWGRYRDDALVWACRYERELRLARMRCAAADGSLAPGVR